MISLLAPSRGRPEQLEEMWASARATSVGEVELCLYLDDDQADAYQPGLERMAAPYHVRYGDENQRLVLSECWNAAYEDACGDILMHAADDIRFRSQGWDAAVAAEFERFPDEIAFVYGRDGYQDENLGTHGFLSRRWVESVGYFVPPYFSSDYNDLWLHDVAGRIGRRVYVPEVFIEHLHPDAGKGEWDRTHLERLERHKRDNPGSLYRDLEGHRAADAEKLLAVMKVAA